MPASVPPKKGERPQKTLRFVAHWLVESNGGNPLGAARDLKRLARHKTPKKLLEYVRRWGSRSGLGLDVGEDMPRPGRRRKISTATDEQLAQWLIEDITVQGKKRRARTVHEVRSPCPVAGFPLCWPNLIQQFSRCRQFLPLAGLSIPSAAVRGFAERGWRHPKRRMEGSETWQSQAVLAGDHLKKAAACQGQRRAAGLC